MDKEQHRVIQLFQLCHCGRLSFLPIALGERRSGRNLLESKLGTIASEMISDVKKQSRISPFCKKLTAPLTLELEFTQNQPKTVSKLSPFNLLTFATARPI